MNPGVHPVVNQNYDATADSDKIGIKRVEEIAEKYGVPMAHISLSWMLHKNPVISPVIWATKISHLENAVEAVNVKLEMDDIAFLEEPYVPHHIVGLIPYGGRLLSARK